jgi:2-oxoacid:acceptor oxidoreductase delta subunit (pyruvate/2-ketoisovalerate family)
MTKKQEFEIRKPPAQIAHSQKPVVLTTLEEYPYKSVALNSTQANLTGLWRYWRPYYQTKRAPCDGACPVGNQVVDYIQSAQDGHWAAAANILRGENPLPGITGRVCHRPCEMACNRRQYDQRIAIHEIETVLAEAPAEPLQFPAPAQPRHVAVVGSGPAELAFAHFAALLGHRVTLYEPEAALGGRLRSGPQAKHLPAGLLDAEVKRIVTGRIEVRQEAVTLEGLTGKYDVIFGVTSSPDQLTLHVGQRGGSAQDRAALVPLLGEGTSPESTIQTPLRVSEAVGYGKWAALLLDADWRGLHPADTLARIQVGGNSRIVSALKYLAVVTGQSLGRTEELVTYDKLQLDMLDTLPGFDPARLSQALGVVSRQFVSAEDVEQVLQETDRCFSCGRCNHCDNCWVYCPDACISHAGDGYQVDYDYCKGCLVCAAVCPRRVISVIEEEKWNE